MKLVPDSFFRRPADVVAPELLGATLVSEVGGRRVAGRIVEVEAYLGHDDPASHAYRGRRHAQNAGLYSPPGHWYVYRSYGIHWCANLVVAGATGSAVLLRGLLPLEGLPVMRRRRHGVADRLLANGPGKLCAALAITGALDKMAMVHSECRVLAPQGSRRGSVVATGRVGISKAVDWPLRFVFEPPPECR